MKYILPLYFIITSGYGFIRQVRKWKSISKNIPNKYHTDTVERYINTCVATIVSPCVWSLFLYNDFLITKEDYKNN